MHWEKKICIRLTARRIVGAVLTASTVVNLVIVGAAYEAAAPSATATATLAPTMLFSPTALSIATVTAGGSVLLPPAQTPGAPETPLFTPTATTMSPQIWIICIKRFYWLDYRVQPGDTLSALAKTTSTTAEELIQANCLADDRIYSGQVLYLPRSPIQPFTPAPSATLTDTATVIATSTPTPTPTGTLPTATASSTQIASSTATYTASATSTPITPSVTPTFTPTYTATFTATPLTLTPSPTPTGTVYITLTFGPAFTTTVVPAAK